MDWYPRYPAKFDHGTLGFSLAERGAYSCLLDLMYLTGEPLPDDDSQLAAMLRVSFKEWRAVCGKVRGKFRSEGGKLVHHVVSQQIAEQRARADKSRENGAKGGRPKKRKTKDNDANNPAGTQQVPSQGPASPPQTDRQTDINTNKETERNGVPKNGAHSRNGNGVDLKFIPQRAPRAFPGNGNLTKEQITEKWFLNCQQWMAQHWDKDRMESAITSYLNGDKREINAASAEREAAVAAGKLREGISPSPKRKCPQI